MSVRSVKFFTNIIRNFSTKPTTNDEINPYVYNRNPRNLERMRLDRKPTGYVVDQVYMEYWHKLVVTPHSRHVVAQIIHYTKKVVIEASTDEWAIYKHLYSKLDKMAYITLAKVFAERCLESGMYNFACDIVPNEQNEKMKAFLEILQEEGLTLKEMPTFDIYNIWHKKREKRPWTVLEDRD